MPSCSVAWRASARTATPETMRVRRYTAQRSLGAARRSSPLPLFKWGAPHLIAARRNSAMHRYAVMPLQRHAAARPVERQPVSCD